MIYGAVKTHHGFVEANSKEGKGSTFHIYIPLLDIVMPHCGGMPLTKRIRVINPDMPVIFLTGYDKGHVLHGDDAIANCFYR